MEILLGLLGLVRIRKELDVVGIGHVIFCTAAIILASDPVVAQREYTHICRQPIVLADRVFDEEPNIVRDSIKELIWDDDFTVLVLEIADERYDQALEVLTCRLFDDSIFFDGHVVVHMKR